MTVDISHGETREGSIFAMPSLGADMTEGRITEWLVQPGDHVDRGQIVVIVETDKSDIEVEVFEPATVVELLVGEGDLVPVGTPIARFAAAGASASGTAPVPARQPEQHVGVPTSTEHATLPVHGHVTSPMIRHLAEDLHVDPEQIHGSGPGGRVHRDDVEAAGHQPMRSRITPRARRLLSERGIDPTTVADQGYVSGDYVLAIEPAPSLEQTLEQTLEQSAEQSAGQTAAQTAAQTAGQTAEQTARQSAPRPTRAETMRRHIADLMTRSWHEIPHFHVSKVIDLGAASDRLAVVNQDRPLTERLVPGSLLLCAAARAAAKVHACNGWWREVGFEQATDVRLGVVLSLRTGGIIVPTIDGADQLNPTEMMGRLTELVQRARQGRLRASDLTEATITVTNLGDLGADSVAGVIHPPQVAIVGFGAVHDEVRPIDATPAVRPVVHASLAGDHRAFDGLAGSRYLAQLQTLLDGPLLEEM